ncbi:hypothetical protein J5N97_015966 [Dioscorea zingiberensis]|uniref:GTD-binding domain-containing protein n=1 Tax=Dioscorea zingiberensis TaxID=325984 RepID=A0A9D5CII0_9LILI|nr:hypothetical protein J5N97_015966 [Dioscorea zingiberensis]
MDGFPMNAFPPILAPFNTFSSIPFSDPSAFLDKIKSSGIQTHAWIDVGIFGIQLFCTMPYITVSDMYFLNFSSAEYQLALLVSSSPRNLSFARVSAISQVFLGMAEKKDPHHFCSALSSAFLEWLLLLLLLLDVTIQYLGSKLASFSCFPMFSNEKKLNSGTYNSSVAKHNLENTEGLEVKFLTNVKGEILQRRFPEDNIMDIEPGSRRNRYCLCCSAPLKNKPHRNGLRRRCNFGGDVAKVGFAPGNEKRKRSPSLKSLHHSEKLSTIDRLSHVGYSGLNVTSDSDAEFANSSDDEHRDVIVLGTETIKKGVTLTDSSDEIIEEKLIQPAPMIPELSFSVCEKQLHPVESHGLSSATSNDAAARSLDELKCVQVKMGTNDPSPSELIIPEQIPKKELNPKGSLADAPNFSSGDVSKTLIPDGNLKATQLLNDSLQTATNASKLDFAIKGSLLSPRFAEIVSRRYSNRVQEDLKSVQPQLPNARGLEFSWNDLVSSPRVPGQIDECKLSLSDFSNSSVMQNINARRLSVDRNETTSECSEVSTVHRFTGDTNIDNLKQQADLDMEFVKVLYKELEEERSASAIAANQAMNMINRLQEEKAAMQMEALQYLRMMEEQAEYDQEALQNANELLTQREKEIQDLEAAVESYRKRFGDEPLSEIVPELLNDLQEREAYQSQFRVAEKASFVIDEY